MSTTRGLHPELEAWHLQPPQPARRRHDLYMLAGLLVRQLDAPRDRAETAFGSAGPSTSVIRECSLRVRSEDLRTLLCSLFDEAESTKLAASASPQWDSVERVGLREEVLLRGKE